jgi:hypothetical protein
LRIWQATLVGLRQSAGQFTTRIKYHHCLMRGGMLENLGQYVIQIIFSNANIGSAYVDGIAGLTEVTGKFCHANFFHFFLKTNS